MWLDTRVRASISTHSPRTFVLLVAIGVLSALALGGIAMAQGSTFTGCLDAKGTLYRVAIGTAPAAPCKSSDTQVSWNEDGPVGPPGPAGIGGATVALVVIHGGADGVGGSSCGNTNYHTIGAGCPGALFQGGELLTAFEVDPGDYPSSAVAVFWTLLHVDAGETYCVRLFDLTAGAALTDSEICTTNSTGTFVTSRLGGPQVNLEAGHLYALQAKHEDLNDNLVSGTIGKAWLVIDWD